MQLFFLPEILAVEKIFCYTVESFNRGVSDVKKKISALVCGALMAFGSIAMTSISDNRPNYVEEIATEDSGFATQDGIIVGMSENFLNDSYGKADKIEREDGKVEYTYYSRDSREKIQFDVRNGIIIKISCERN